MRVVMLSAVLAAGAAALPMAQAPAGGSQVELKVGDQAPDFSLQASDGKTYQLSSFKGKQAIVLAWFPKAMTSGCTLECKSLAEHGDMIRKYDVTYFMASVDPLDKNTEFAKATSVDLGARGGVVAKKEADFPILSDPTKATAKAYGVLNDQAGFANRWTFYIGKDGKIQAIDKEVGKHVQTSAEDMAAKLGELGVAKK
ncbi:MAG TPA: peroxiredoxin family protein [Vicinamibacterales bacterium]|jgi:peroxiredoxin Q/BCP